MGLGETGTEQFTITTRRDGELIKEQPIHDPFVHSTTTICISRWDLFKALFKKQYITKVQIILRGSEGAQRAIMMLDPAALEAETQLILEQRRLNRESNAGNNHCFMVVERERPAERKESES